MVQIVRTVQVTLHYWVSMEAAPDPVIAGRVFEQVRRFQLTSVPGLQPGF